MADPKFANDFLVGADPEMVAMNPPRIAVLRHETNPLFGFDHNNLVLEPHPAPSRSAREVCDNIRSSLDYINFLWGTHHVFRAGAYITSPERAHLGLGGHVHLDLPTLSGDQITAMDTLAMGFERVGILPNAACCNRRDATGYGHLSDVRAERGRVEYRSLCSWLFSRRAAMLSLTAIKLAAVAPQTVPTRIEDMPTLRNWLEGFKEADDDARFILEKGYFDRDLTAKPDESVLERWRSCGLRGRNLATKLYNDKAQKDVERQRRVAEENAVTLANFARYDGVATMRTVPAPWAPPQAPQVQTQEEDPRSDTEPNRWRGSNGAEFARHRERFVRNGDGLARRVRLSSAGRGYVETLQHYQWRTGSRHPLA